MTAYLENVKHAVATVDFVRKAAVECSVWAWGCLFLVIGGRAEHGRRLSRTKLLNPLHVIFKPRASAKKIGRVIS
jgi:hypothetical protein